MDLPLYLLQLLNRSNATAILGVYDRDGNLDLVPLATIKAPRPNLILLPQNTERETRDALTEAMERNQLVSILCLESLQGEGRAYQMTCAVREYQTTGPLYEKFIDELRVSYAGLQGVWILEPVGVKERY